MSKDEIKLEYYIRLKTLNYIDLNEVLTQQLAKEMTDVHEQLLIHSVVVPKGTLFCQCKDPAQWTTDEGFVGCVKCNKGIKAK